MSCRIDCSSRPMRSRSFSRLSSSPRRVSVCSSRLASRSSFRRSSSRRTRTSSSASRLMPAISSRTSSSACWTFTSASCSASETSFAARTSAELTLLATIMRRVYSPATTPTARATTATIAHSIVLASRHTQVSGAAPDSAPLGVEVRKWVNARPAAGSTYALVRSTASSDHQAVRFVCPSGGRCPRFPCSRRMPNCCWVESKTASPVNVRVAGPACKSKTATPGLGVDRTTRTRHVLSRPRGDQGSMNS